MEAEQKSKRTGQSGYAEEARLRVYRPAEYKRKRDAGLLWSQVYETDEAQDEPNDEFDESPYLEDSDASYDETAAPETRPQPRRHISTVPMTDEQMAALLRAVPQLQTLDPRLLRTMSGSAGVARDVSGVDPATGIYHALPGETPHGITKKLTGQVERTQELLAANPGKSETAREWHIPPGWLQFARETGAITFITSRKYTVVLNDTPIGIAKRMNAFVDRPQWWSELKAANPHKPTQSGTGNWVSLYPNEEIGIPDAWPQTPLAVPVGELPTTGNQTDPPGLPAPGKTTTLDPGVVPHAQALLAKWAYQNPNDCNPSDYGRNPMDFVSGVTPRTTQALSSFQTWWNKKQPTRALNTTGELDTATYHALIEADNVANTPGQNQQQPTPTPSGNEQPAPTNGAPPGWPKEWPWPPIPGTSTTTSQQPSGGASTSPSTNTQPAPNTNTQTQSNGEPPGWPKEWPWPPIPGTSTTTSPQPSGGASTSPSTNTQPAPNTQTQSNGAPPGWPKEWPWPPLPGYTVPLPTTQQPSGNTSTGPNTNTQPPETTQSNGAPPGWPKEWPWPPIPVNTTPQQQPQPQPTPTPSGNEQPAPTNGAPPGWPKEWPWPPIPVNTTPQQQPQQQQPPAQPSPQQPPPQQQQPAPNAPLLDSHLTPAERDQLLAYLAYGRNADEMDRIATERAADGYPLTAIALHRRAAELRNQYPEDHGPPVIFVENVEPVPTYTNESGGSGGSVLPALALLGAGLVLS